MKILEFFYKKIKWLYRESCMSFKDFIINYFSPVFFILRCFLLWTSFCLYFLLPFVLASHGFDVGLAKGIGIIVSLYLLYKALKPWRVGMTIGEAMKKINNFSGKN